jgi:tetratricopeptide (TPR) repeat protein
MGRDGFSTDPYKGLVPYSEEDALFFFGREEKVEIIAANLLARRLTLLRGESGVGKSSVLGAGVTHKLRQMARENLDASGKPGFAITLVRDWKDDTVAKLKQSVEQAVKQAFCRMPVEPVPESLPLAETLRLWADRAGGVLLIILDQFEEYFIYQTQESGDGTFARQIADLLMSRDANVNLLISIRSDAYEKLEQFKREIPYIFDNSLRIDHLDLDAASDAIRKPIERYNKVFAAGRGRFSPEHKLVETVLSQLQELETGESVWGETEAKAGPRVEKPEIKAPFLQLVMRRLWEEELHSNSTTLRLATLERLGKAQGIVSGHLDRAMKALTPEEQEIARRAFRHLVTSSETKYAYSARDLDDHLGVGEEKLSNVLEKLSRSENRILSTVDPQKKGAATRYEIFHDMLAKPILKYVREQEQADALKKERDKAKAQRLKIFIAAGVLLAILIAGLYAYYQNVKAKEAETARTQEQKLREQEQELGEKVRKEKNLAVATFLLQMGAFSELLYKNDDFKGNQERFQEALEFYRQRGNTVGEGMVRASMGELYYRNGDYAKAEENYQQAREVLERALSPEHPYVAVVLNRLALACYDQGKYNEVEPLYSKAREILENSLGPSNSEVATSLIGLVELYQRQGRYAEAEPLFKQALEIHQEALGLNHQQVALDLTQLAALYVELSRYAEAESLYERARVILENVLGPEHSTVATVLQNLGSAYSLDGKFALAQPLLLEALDIQERAREQSDRKVASVSNDLANFMIEQGKYEDALVLHEDALETRESLFGKDHPVIASSLNGLAYAYSKIGNCNKAMPLFQRALNIREQVFGSDHPYVARTLNGLAECYRDTGKYDEAESLFRRALSIREEKLGPQNADAAATLNSLALLYYRQARYADAESSLRQALSIRESALRPEHPKIAETLSDLAMLLRATNRADEAASMEARARQIREKNKQENATNQ